MNFSSFKKSETAYGQEDIHLTTCMVYRTSRNAKVRAYMQSQSLLLPAIQTIHKITNARTGYHKQSHEKNPH